MEVEFIIPTYNRPHHLMCVINSIYSQTNPNWRIHVVADAIYDGYDKVKNYFIDDEKIKFSELEGPHNDWGHTARQYGVDNSKSEWVVMSGDDNYYVPHFLDYFLNSVDGETTFVFCDMIHNWINNEYVYLKTYPKKDHIDIGCFMSKTEMAKQIRLDKTRGDADGLFVEEYLTKFPNGKIMYIPKPLYVHN
jgi:glycosyltransferase involved in cell wall biosynthesis